MLLEMKSQINNAAVFFGIQHQRPVTAVIGIGIIVSISISISIKKSSLRSSATSAVDGFSGGGLLRG